MWRVLVLAAMAACVAGCDLLEPQPFEVAVVPAELTDTIPLQRCVLLVEVEESATPGLFPLPVIITATSSDATVRVQNPLIYPGEVAEVTVIPAPLENGEQPDNGDGRDISVTIVGTRSGLVETKVVPIHIWSEEEDLLLEMAEEMRDLFIPWLAAERPELGIDENTEWTGTIVTPHILVVTHYLFFSEEWELHVYWHVMIPPFDWAKIELRKRYEETLPSEAFEIPSRSADPVTVNEIEPSDSLWR